MRLNFVIKYVLAIFLLSAITTSSTSPAAVLQFKSFMKASPFFDGNHWLLTEELEYDVYNTGIIVPVPRGFVTDFTSVPRPFWSLLPRWGKYGPSAVVHDFLYWDQRCSRAQADRIMVLAMQESGVGPFRTTLIHTAIRLGGSFAWRSNRKARERGKIRQIPYGMEPTNPDITLERTWEKFEEFLREEGVTEEPRPSHAPPPDYCIQADIEWKKIHDKRNAVSVL